MGDRILTAEFNYPGPTLPQIQLLRDPSRSVPIHSFLRGEAEVQLFENVLLNEYFGRNAEENYVTLRLQFRDGKPSLYLANWDPELLGIISTVINQRNDRVFTAEIEAQVDAFGTPLRSARSYGIVDNLVDGNDHEQVLQTIVGRPDVGMNLEFQNYTYSAFFANEDPFVGVFLTLDRTGKFLGQLQLWSGVKNPNN